jgi:hypothetical protein
MSHNVARLNPIQSSKLMLLKSISSNHIENKMKNRMSVVEIFFIFIGGCDILFSRGKALKLPLSWAYSSLSRFRFLSLSYSSKAVLTLAKIAAIVRAIFLISSTFFHLLSDFIIPNLFTLVNRFNKKIFYFCYFLNKKIPARRQVSYFINIFIFI